MNAMAPLEAETLQAVDVLMERCARCGGRFPGRGVERDGRFYCCDGCAAKGRRTPVDSLRDALPLAAAVGLGFGAGTLLGRYIGRQ